MQGPQRSPPPGPQPVGGAVPTAFVVDGVWKLPGFENQREIAKAGTIGVAGPPREIGEKHMGCGVLCSKLYTYRSGLPRKKTF